MIKVTLNKDISKSGYKVRTLLILNLIGIGTSLFLGIFLDNGGDGFGYTLLGFGVIGLSTLLAVAVLMILERHLILPNIFTIMICCLLSIIEIYMLTNLAAFDWIK